MLMDEEDNKSKASSIKEVVPEGSQNQGDHSPEGGLKGWATVLGA